MPEEEAAVTWGLEKTGNLNGIVDSIRIEGGTNAKWNVDALRLGTTFDSVVFTDGVVPEVLGDLNADGQITIIDWIELKSNYGLDTSGMNIPQQQDLGDLDSSGKIDIGDFLQFRGLYNASNSSGAFASLVKSVPEPSSMAFAAVFVAAIVYKFHDCVLILCPTLVRDGIERRGRRSIGTAKRTNVNTMLTEIQ